MSSLERFKQRQAPVAATPTADQPLPKKQRRATSAGAEQFLTYIHRDAIRQIKIAVANGHADSASDLVRHALNDWFAARGMPRCA